jgi:phosphatidate cytidylyltransferase
LESQIRRAVASSWFVFSRNDHLSNLTQRILVALLAIPLFVFVALKGGLFFFALVALIATLGLYEFYKLAEKKSASPQILIGTLFGFAVVSVFIMERIPVPWNHDATDFFFLLFIVFVPGIMLAELFRKKQHPTLNITTTIAGVAYVSLFLGTLVGIRELFMPATPFFESAAISPDRITRIYDWGGRTILTLFVSIWVCDSLAYFAGKHFGKHKLMERVSPKKTWEGAIAGYLGAVAVFLISQQYFLPYMSAATAIVCGSIVGIGGQLGDLVESLLKRDGGVKDSSALIPGHGGVLDRFDSLMFVSPLMYLYLRFVVFSSTLSLWGG